MAERRYRVLVVDDSAFARKVVREVLSTSRQLDVVDIARDGLEALEKIASLKPDVVTLDLVMPQLDGLGVLRALPAENAPRVVVVSMSDAESALGIEALEAGAVDVVHKPTAHATDRLYELGQELREKVLAAAEARRMPASPLPARPTAVSVPSSRAARRGTQLVVVGTSTGGPQALTRLLASLPGDFPVPVVVALHIPSGYTQSLAARLDAQVPLHVVEGRDGLALEPGTVVIAPGGSHLRIDPAEGGPLRVRVDNRGDGGLHVPSVNALFESAAVRVKSKVLGLVLTGMGDDGLTGSRKIRDAGGVVLTEAEASCVVYGMPRAVTEANLATDQAPLDRIGDLLVRYL